MEMQEVLDPKAIVANIKIPGKGPTPIEIKYSLGVAIKAKLALGYDPLPLFDEGKAGLVEVAAVLWGMVVLGGYKEISFDDFTHNLTFKDVGDLVDSLRKSMLVSTGVEEGNEQSAEKKTKKSKKPIN